MAKRSIFIAALLALVIMLMTNCASKRVGINTDSGADCKFESQNIIEMADDLAKQIVMANLDLRGKTIALSVVENKSSDQSFNCDMITEKVKLQIKAATGCLFVERKRLEVLREEQRLNRNQTAEHVQKENNLWGADFLMYGRIDSLEKTKNNVFSTKAVSYFRLNLNLTNSTSGVELWSGEVEFKKTQSKVKGWVKSAGGVVAGIGAVLLGNKIDKK